MPAPSLWSRLRETRLVQALVVYLAGAWVAVQVVALFSSAFEWPKWVMRGAIVLLATGLVATLVLGWAHARAQARVSVAEGSTPQTRPLVAGAVAVTLLLVGGALYFVIQDRGRALAPEAALASAAPGIAILPFSVNDPELDRWREGMVDVLSTNLDGAAGLRAIDSRTVLARWRERVGEGRDADLATALDVARRAGGRYGLVGSIVSAGPSMRVVADVYDLASARSLGQERVEGAPDSIFALVDRLSIEVLGVILERDRGELPDVDLARVTTTSLPALKAFLDAEALFRRSDFENAIPAYERAIEADSTFALALARLSTALGWTEGYESERALESMTRAARHADRLPPRDGELLRAAVAFLDQGPTATELARAAVEKYPDDPEVWNILGEDYFHLPYQSLADREKTDDAFQHAIRLDPSYAPAYIHLLDDAFRHADSTAAAGWLERFDRLAGGSRYDADYRTGFELAFAGSARRRAALDRLDPTDRRRVGRIAQLLNHPRFTRVQAAVGRRVAESGFVPPGLIDVGLTWLDLTRGRVRAALERMERPDFPEDGRVDLLSFAYALDLPVPRETFERAFALGPADTSANDTQLRRAIYALENGRRDVYDRLVALGTRFAAAAEAKGDSLEARRMRATLDGLRGRDLMLKGRDDEALPLVEGAFRETGIPFFAGWATELHAHAGRWDRAAAYLRLSPPNGWSGLKAGPVFEKAGLRDEALAAYSWTITALRDGDPEVQPYVEQARQGIFRVQGLQRG